MTPMPSERDKTNDSHFTLNVRIPKPSRQWLRISLRSFIALVLLAAVLLSVWGKRVRERMEQAEYFHRVYSVAPLVVVKKTGSVDYGSLIDEIEKLEPQSWGPSRGSIEEFPTNLAIVVTQRDSVHEKIERLLEEKQQRMSK